MPKKSKICYSARKILIWSPYCIVYWLMLNLHVCEGIFLNLLPLSLNMVKFFRVCMTTTAAWTNGHSFTNNFIWSDSCVSMCVDWLLTVLTSHIQLIVQLKPDNWLFLRLRTSERCTRKLRPIIGLLLYFSHLWKRFSC